MCPELEGHQTKTRTCWEEKIMLGKTNTGEGRPRGLYYAEYVGVTSENPEAHLQDVLNAKEGKEWHLVGVAGGLPDGGMILFWDTARPSFGRAAYG